jgi:ABC-type transporter Mla subunit MlaD
LKRSSSLHQLRTAIENFTRIANDLQARIDPILLRVNRILEDSEDRIATVMGDAAEISRIARGQAQKVDRVFTEAVERLRVQVIRADQILTGALEVVEDAGTKFRKTLWGPIHQASALLKGLKVGLDFIRGQQRRRQEPDSATQDEELFI